MVLPMLSEYYSSMTMNFDHAYMYVSRRNHALLVIILQYE